MSESDIVFIHIKEQEIPEKDRESFVMAPSEKIVFFVYGFKKSYHGEEKGAEISSWVKEIAQTEVLDLDEHELDHHEHEIFVYVQKSVWEANREHLSIIAKLIHPIPLASSAEQDILAVYIPDVQERDHLSQFFIYRKYDEQIIDIDFSLTLDEKDEFIKRNEFPDFIKAIPQAHYLLYKLKIPTLVYFTENLEEDK